MFIKIIMGDKNGVLNLAFKMNEAQCNHWLMLSPIKCDHLKKSHLLNVIE